MNPDNLFVVTGGPGSGKTALICALKKAGYVCSEEAGRRVIQEQVAAGGEALPWKNPALFLEAMFALEMKSYRMLSTHPDPVFFDRGIPDLLGASALMDLAISAHIEKAAQDFRYNRQVFIAPPWPEIFTNDAERKQTWEEAERTYHQMVETYTCCGYELIELPLTSVEARMKFVLEQVRLARAALHQG